MPAPNRLTICRSPRAALQWHPCLPSPAAARKTPTPKAGRFSMATFRSARSGSRRRPCRRRSMGLELRLPSTELGPGHRRDVRGGAGRLRGRVARLLTRLTSLSIDGFAIGLPGNMRCGMPASNCRHSCPMDARGAFAGRPSILRARVSTFARPT